jgi:hypothetical protein
MKPARLLIVFLIGCTSILLVVLLLWRRCSLAVITQELSDGTQYNASSGHPVGQSFASHYPGLAEIAVKFSNLTELQSAIVNLYLIDATLDTEEGTRIVRGRVDELFEGGWIRFKFEPLDSSKGKSYIFLIEPEGSTPIALLSQAENIYPEGDSTEGGDLVFEIRYHGQCMATLWTLLERLSEQKPGILGFPATYGILLAILLLAAAGTIIASLKDFRS